MPEYSKFLFDLLLHERPLWLSVTLTPGMLRHTEPRSTENLETAGAKFVRVLDCGGINVSERPLAVDYVLGNNAGNQPETRIRRQVRFRGIPLLSHSLPIGYTYKGIVR